MRGGRAAGVSVVCRPAARRRTRLSRDSTYPAVSITGASSQASSSTTRARLEYRIERDQGHIQARGAPRTVRGIDGGHHLSMARKPGNAVVGNVWAAQSRSSSAAGAGAETGCRCASSGALTGISHRGLNRAGKSQLHARLPADRSNIDVDSGWFATPRISLGLLGVAKRRLLTRYLSNAAPNAGHLFLSQPCLATANRRDS